ncbi:MAG TPA: hypothetical protein VKY74_21005 [Chloroflexia bacterium]|nr:hypothetical protein [Chloroflexia bacterium]
MTITLNPNEAGHWLVLLLIAALAGLAVEVVRGGGLPLGFVGEIAAAALGAWIGGDLVQAHIVIMPQPAFQGVALVPAIVGALIIGFLWGLLGGRRRQRYY